MADRPGITWKREMLGLVSSYAEVRFLRPVSKRLLPLVLLLWLTGTVMPVHRPRQAFNNPYRRFHSLIYRYGCLSNP